ncbi:MAG TPA: DUF4249 domain-containing protein [Paludibacter sp.]|nr:DUF4249 domain-containing protein [Paludibacter sp.]
MKFLKPYILPIILFSLVFVACDNEIKFNGTEATTKMVMNSLLSPDSVVKVQLTKSLFFLKDDSKFETIDNALVKLFVNNQFTENLQFTTSGIYVGSYIPKPGDKIKITASNREFSEVSGETEIPEINPILSVDTTSIIMAEYPIPGNYDPVKNRSDTIGKSVTRQLNFIVYFQDRKDIANYYRIKVKLRHYFADGNYYDDLYSFHSDDLVFSSTDEGSITGESSISQYHEFSDDSFNGKKYGLKFSLYSTENDYFPGKDPFQQDGNGVSTYAPIKQEVHISLQSISESYYMYIKTRTVDNSGDYFSEPVQIFNNVANGIGFVGSYSPSNHVLELPVKYIVGYGGPD